MDEPVKEIREVILRLTKGSPATQEQTLKRYFTHNASFLHPFVGVRDNRGPIIRIFQWYKILSPRIDIAINSIAYDAQNLLLYVNISQVFRIWFIPFYAAPVTLTTVLQLERGIDLNTSQPLSNMNSLRPEKYYISSQNDLYQVDQFIRFVLPWGIGTTLVLVWHWFATLCCILGAILFAPLRWNQQILADATPQRPDETQVSAEPATENRESGEQAWEPAWERARNTQAKSSSTPVNGRNSRHRV